MNGKVFRWWHGVGIFVVANLLSLLPAGFNGDEAFYNQFRKPSFSPPDWLFPPMWLVLNITSLMALQRIWNKEPSQNRTIFIVSEAAGWVLFVVFPLVYFGLKSATLGALDTVGSLAIAAVSVVTAGQIDRRSAAFVALRLAWLLLASYVAVWIALNN